MLGSRFALSRAKLGLRKRWSLAIEKSGSGDSAWCVTFELRTTFYVLRVLSASWGRLPLILAGVYTPTLLENAANEVG